MSRLLVPRLLPTQTRARARLVPSAAARAFQCLHLHSSAPAPAIALPITAHGPPPKPPLPAGEIADLRRRQKLEAAQDLAVKGQPGKGRFWKEVKIIDTDGPGVLPTTLKQASKLTLPPPHPPGGLGITLDTRPLKTPAGNPLVIPSSKPLLAATIALEWSLLRSSADAAKGYLIPLTQLSSRALDLDLDPARRGDIVTDLMRYLDTDTLLCLAPTSAGVVRKQQEEAAAPIVAFLAGVVWPGVVLVPVDGDVGMVHVKPQPQATRDVVAAWTAALGRWDLVALERAVLATKSMCIAARLVAEWSAEAGCSRGPGKSFGVREAAAAASVEVRFQTGRWGEVEDTHDVEKEDLKRQLGASVLLAAGEELQGLLSRPSPSSPSPRS